jgi:hypothetical protein
MTPFDSPRSPAPSRRAAALGRSLSIMVAKRAGQILCNLWSEQMQVTGQVECKWVVKWNAILHFESREATARWTSTPKKALGGSRSVSICVTEIGAELARRVFHALESGGGG